MRKEKKTWK